MAPRLRALRRLPARWRLHLVFWIASIAVGATAVAFAQIADKAGMLQRQWLSFSPWIFVLCAPLGIGFLVWVTEKFYRQASGSGIPQVIAALQMPSSDKRRLALLAWPVALVKIAMTSMGLLLGLSIGREGPTIQVGAAMMLASGKWARFPSRYLEKGLILAGGAAGLAAAFNTPLAGIVFTIEELSHSFEEKINGLILTAVIFSGLIALALMGNYYYFGQVKATLPQSRDWFAIPLCGTCGGLLGGSFSACLLWGNRRLKPFRQARPWLFGMGLGLLIALLGLFSWGHTYGTGYIEAKILLGHPDASIATYAPTLWSPLLKILATLLSYFTGIPGGLFSPSLAAGTELGAALARFFSSVPKEGIVLLGMAAYFTGVVQTPLTALVIIMEMTHNNDMMLPLMITILLAQAASRLICRKPLYQSLAEDFMRS